jgi:anaerobic magnesium-protoporphyrin IX monomethyl ester cyclase
MVGISMLTPQLAAGTEAARMVRSLAPGALLIAGGPHPTVMPGDTMRRLSPDLLLRGEAEVSFGMLLDGEEWDSIPGAVYPGNDGPTASKARRIVPDLDTLPLPDRSLFDMETYIRHWYSMDRVDPGLRGTTVMATRGCPYHCAYCQPTLSMIFGRKLRKRSPGAIVEELENLVETYRINAFMFEDSTFIVDHPWVHGICDRLIGSGLRLSWCCNVRADLLTGELLDHMVEAGLRKVNMGVETASQRVLDEIYQKGITVEGVRRALRLCKERGVFVQGYFMLGTPGETLEEMKRTIRFASEEPFDDALFDITTPFPQTTLWERTKHLIRSDYTHFDCFQNCVYDLDGISPKRIERLKKQAFWKFYLHPRRLAATMRTVLGFRNAKRTMIKARRV